MSAQGTANPNIDPKRYSAFWFRFYEILPGACVWLALITPFVVSFYLPLSVTIFILIFDVYWLLQTVNQSFILISGYRRLRKNLATDWMIRLKGLDELSAEEQKNLNIIDWHSIYQTVILATYKEELSILEASLDSIINSPYPKDKMIFVLATEERDAENARSFGDYLKKKYAHHFFLFLVTEHPDGIVGEVKAKGANVTWAAKELVRELHAKNIALDQVVVSTADADTRFTPHYFPCLAFAYAVTPNRIHCSFQPIATYFNNIWEAPMTSRILAFGTTFWQLVESVRNYRLITFSTHATSLKTLHDMNYWCTSIVNEDSRQFFRAYFHYKGDFHVVPLFVPIYMDAVHTGSFWSTLRSLYLQQQRWAYGVEHFPYIVLESLQQPRIPLINRTMLIYRAFQGTFSWATSSFFISLVGWIPIFLNPTFRDQVAVSNFPLTTTVILSFTWVGIVVSTVLTLKILHPLEQNKSIRQRLGMIVMWLIVPALGITLSALPCLDALTRLMFGRYLGFRVTEKVRLKSA